MDIIDSEGKLMKFPFVSEQCAKSSLVTRVINISQAIINQHLESLFQILHQY